MFQAIWLWRDALQQQLAGVSVFPSSRSRGNSRRCQRRRKLNARISASHGHPLRVEQNSLPNGSWFIGQRVSIGAARQKQEIHPVGGENHSPIIFTWTRLWRLPPNSPWKICCHGPKSNLPFVMATTTSRL